MRSRRVRCTPPFSDLVMVSVSFAFSPFKHHSLVIYDKFLLFFDFYRQMTTDIPSLFVWRTSDFPIVPVGLISSPRHGSLEIRFGFYGLDYVVLLFSEFF